MLLNILSIGHGNVDLNVAYDLDGQTEEVTNSAYTLIYNLIDEVVCTLFIYYLFDFEVLKVFHVTC